MRLSFKCLANYLFDNLNYIVTLKGKYIVFFLLFTFYSYTQKNESGRYVRNWKIVDFLGTVDSIQTDSAHLNFQHLLYPIDMFSIANSYNGNLLSPIQSKVFNDRPESDGFLFRNAYAPFIQNIGSNRFYRTKSPLSSIKFVTGGTNYHESERFGFKFSANANKKLNFGLDIDYIYARGEYTDQAGKLFNGGFFGSFNGRRYSGSGLISFNSISNKENGGITDDVYITNPPAGYEDAKNFPINIKVDAQSSFKQFHLFYNHSYSLGFDRKLEGTKDTVIYEYIPVTRFIHTISLDNYQKRYFESTPETEFYKNTFRSVTNDTAALQRLSNRFAINLAEEFNKWMRFGLTAYVHNDIERFVFSRDSLLKDSVLNTIRVGGELSKRLGQKFTYKLNADVALMGYRVGDFKLSADLGTRFRLWKDTIEMNANAYTSTMEADFHMKHYESNHFVWNSDFAKVFKTYVGGRFAIPNKQFWLDVGVQNISNYIYFDSIALPIQYSGSIQIVSAKLIKNFRFGRFGLDNTIIYQENFNNDYILPLPKISLYHNLFYSDRWFKVLSAQLGTYVRYHSAYYAPAYMPATGQFYSQKTTKVGNYPVISLYANFHLKRTRFFFEYFHLNQLFMKGVYYSMPNYPINPATLRMGLTWNFYD